MKKRDTDLSNALAGGDLPLKNIRDQIDFDLADAWLAFELNGRRIKWPITLNGDWVDGKVFGRFARLLASRRARGKRFTFFNLGGQDCLIGCTTPRQVRQLRKETGVWFAHLGAGHV